MYKERIDAYMAEKKEEMLDDLISLIKINSQRGVAEENMPFGKGPAMVIARAEELIKKYGFTATNYDNYVVTADFSDQEKELDILAHLDVVPVTDDWTVTAPFEPKIIGERIYGRGTADDKGPAIAALYAMRAIRELGIPLKKSVRLILGSDEECGSSDLKYYYSKEKEAPWSFTPDADFPVINIEKGRLAPSFEAEFAQEDAQKKILLFKSGDKVNVVPQKAMAQIVGVEQTTVLESMDRVGFDTGVRFSIERKKEGILEIQAKGVAAHASTPAEGKNALTALLKLLSEIQLDDTKLQRAFMGLNKLFPYEDTKGEALGIQRKDPEAGEVTVCLSMLSYENGKISGAFDARLSLGCTEENTRIPVKEALEHYGIYMSGEAMTAPHCVPSDSKLVQTLLKSYEKYTGVKGMPLSTGGGTYVHHLERGVAFGCMTPDVDNHMHGDDEFMVIERLLESACIFADAIIEICGIN